MIQMLRKEACSGAIDDLAHVRTEVCLSDCLTKDSAKAHNLRLAVETSVLPDVDMHPSFRTLMQHKAFLHEWLQCYVGDCVYFLGEHVGDMSLDAATVSRKSCLHFAATLKLQRERHSQHPACI